jgi:hypothetical protein
MVDSDSSLGDESNNVLFFELALFFHEINTFLEIQFLINTETKTATEAELVKIGLSP